MSKSNIKQLAALLGIPVDHFIHQLKQAEVEVSSEDQTLSNREKEQLRAYLSKQTQTKEKRLNDQPVVTKRTSIKEFKLKGGKTQATVNITVKRKKAAYIQHLPTQTETTSLLEIKELPAAFWDAISDVHDVVASEQVEASPETVLHKSALPSEENEETSEEYSHQNKKEKSPKHHRTDSKQKRYEKEGVYRTEASFKETVKSFRPKSYKQKKAGLKQEFEKPTSPITREVTIPEAITVAELAQKMSVKVGEVISQLIKLGILASATQTLEQETASILVEEMGHTPKLIDALEVDLQTNTLQSINRAAPVIRPPVITIMGHVDHGKTSLLDYIRRTKVASGEAGGITQHIGAYHVELPKGVITFLDTPGHAAFTAMRARGARLTDIVALIVAADDGVMPQTIEAIQHAQAANVPIVVAVNKMDKPNADLDRIQQELANHQLIPESWGGETLFVPVSAKTGVGVDALLESLLLQAELLDLKAPDTGPARGIIIESRLDKGRGPVATMLVQSGKLNKGDILLVGATYGRIRALYNENGVKVPSAGPSIPVEILGLSEVATSGEEAVVVPNERKAREAALFRFAAVRESKMKRLSKNKEEGLINQINSQTRKSLNIVLKADVQGSAEVLRDSLNKLSTEEIQVKLLSTGIGALTESDVNLALASKAILLGFNVRADNAAKQIVRRENLEIHYHSVIYELLDHVKQVMGGLLTPITKETILGLAEVREVFRSAKLGTIAGCQVTEGLIKRLCPIRVLRDNVIIHQGELTSLKRFKEDVNEVRVGTECGAAIKNYTDIKAGDMIEVYERVVVTRTDLAA